MSKLGEYTNNPDVTETICAALWSHARVTVEGTVTPCCRYNHHVHSEQPQLKDGIGKAINSDYFQSVRDRMLNGEKIKECNQCYEEEKLTGSSMRTEFNDNYARYILDEPKIRYLETAFSSHCNLACRMCNDVASSKWKLINNPGMKVDVSIDANDISYYDDTDLSELRRMKLVGGEPLLSKDHIKYLDNFISRSSNPEDITLYYNTNGTVFPNKNILDHWSRVKKVSITFSIDGIGGLNDYLRPGSSWSTLTNNIEKFKSLENINIDFTTHTVVSNLNIFKLAPLIKWKTKIFGNPGGFFVLDRPPHLSIKNVPGEMKKSILKYIDRVYDGTEIYDMIRNELDNESKIEYTYKDVAKKEKKLDMYFNQDISKVWRE